jgi:hypothetical protein
MRTIPHPARRQGLSLLEVIVALVVFLFGLIGLGTLMTQGKDHAQAVQLQTQAIQLCQAKMGEVMAGAIPLNGPQADSPLDEDPDWKWSMDAEQGPVTGLLVVSIRVTRTGSQIEATLNQMVLDPTIRGSGPAVNPRGGGSGGGTAGSGGGTAGTAGGATGASSGSSRPTTGSPIGGSQQPSGGSSRPPGSGTSQPPGGGSNRPPGSGGTPPPPPSGGSGRTTGSGSPPPPSGGNSGR